MQNNEFYKNGQKVHQLTDDKLTYFFKNGKVKAEGTFKNELMEDEWKFYRATGQLWQVGNFKNSKKDGSWIRYNKNDQIEYSETFINDKKISHQVDNDLQEIFKRIKELMKKYENPLIAKIDYGSRYDLWSVKDIVVEGRKKKEVFFAGLIIQSNYVGFYYMPVYTEDKIKDMFSDDLLKLLKGKSCFHIKKLNEDLEKQIDNALETGYIMYKERNWII